MSLLLLTLHLLCLFTRVVRRYHEGYTINGSTSCAPDHLADTELVAHLGMAPVTNEEVVDWSTFVHVIAGCADEYVAVASNYLTECAPFAVNGPELADRVHIGNS